MAHVRVGRTIPVGPLARGLLRMVLLVGAAAAAYAAISLLDGPARADPPRAAAPLALADSGGLLGPVGDLGAAGDAVADLLSTSDGPTSANTATKPPAAAKPVAEPAAEPAAKPPATGAGGRNDQDASVPAVPAGPTASPGRQEAPVKVTKARPPADPPLGTPVRAGPAGGTSGAVTATVKIVPSVLADAVRIPEIAQVPGPVRALASGDLGMATGSPIASEILQIPQTISAGLGPVLDPVGAAGVLDAVEVAGVVDGAIGAAGVVDGAIGAAGVVDGAIGAAGVVDGAIGVVDVVDGAAGVVDAVGATISSQLTPATDLLPLPTIAVPAPVLPVDPGGVQTGPAGDGVGAPDRRAEALVAAPAETDSRGPPTAAVAATTGPTQDAESRAGTAGWRSVDVAAAGPRPQTRQGQPGRPGGQPDRTPAAPDSAAQGHARAGGETSPERLAADGQSAWQQALAAGPVVSPADTTRAGRSAEADAPSG
jgi:hypothetical protein